jgi:C-terminal processing protease CtpA/Prc
VCVEPDGEAAQQGIHTGTVITHWNDIPVQEAKNSYMLPIQSPVAENDEPTRTLLLAGQGGETISVTFLADDGQSKAVTLHRMGEYMARFTKAYGQFAHQVENDENFSYKMVSDTCGYLRIHSEALNPFEVIYVTFSGKAPFIENRVDDILTELQAQGMQTLIIDIRNNTGGQSTVSAAVASLFTEDTYTHSWSTLDYNSNEEITQGESLIVYGNGKWKELPVVVLVNQNTASAGDAMADMLSRLPNVTLMGITPSNGSFQATGGLVFLAEGYFSINYPVWLEADQNGNPNIDTDVTRQARIPLEVEIPLDEEAIKTIYTEDGRDYELEYAIQWLLDQK